ncbi:GIMA4 GTPase, partial [Amia calva]|nr:GIMA4 GTPase [Amia calva]
MAVVDTPGLFDTSLTPEEVMLEIAGCVARSSPGPHAFLLVLQLGRFTQEEREAVRIIQTVFGENAARHTIVLFTHADDLEDETVDGLLNTDQAVRELIEKCGSRYLAFNNRSPGDRSQVERLLGMIDRMVAENGGSHYTNDTFQTVEEEIKKKQEEVMEKNKVEMLKEQEALKAQYERKLQQVRESMLGERTSAGQEMLRREPEEKLNRDLEEVLRNYREKARDEVEKSTEIKKIVLVAVALGIMASGSSLLAAGVAWSSAAQAAAAAEIGVVATLVSCASAIVVEAPKVAAAAIALSKTLSTIQSSCTIQ